MKISKQRAIYEKSKLDYLGVKAVSDTAREEGREEGKIEGIEIGVSKRDTELVIRFFLQNKTAIEISDLLGLPLDRVEQIITDYLGSK